MARRAKIDFGEIIVYVLLLMLLAFVGAFLARFTNNFTSDFKTFYVVCDYEREEIINDKENYVLGTNMGYRFDVKYTLEFLQKDEKKLGYHVKILPNTTETTDFDFSVNGNDYPYSGEKDLTSCFDIELYDEYFTFKATKDLSDMLSMLYLYEPVTNAPKAIDSGIPYFLMLISSEDYETELRIAFQLVTPAIYLTSDKVIF